MHVSAPAAAAPEIAKSDLCSCFRFCLNFEIDIHRNFYAWVVDCESTYQDDCVLDDI